MNIKEKFLKWYKPQAPVSYQTWWGKGCERKIDEINDAFRKSFGFDLFEIEESNLDNTITNISNSLKNKENVTNKEFAQYSKNASNGIPNAIINAGYIRFLKKLKAEDVEVNDEVPIDDDSLVANNFTYEKDLQNSMISQAEALFPGYEIYGENNEGIEYSVSGKRIDLLMKSKVGKKLLAIELKAGKADFRVFGQISMYLQLLEEIFRDYEIQGIIVASDIDESLKISSRRDKNVSLRTYRMELMLSEINKNEN